MEEFGKKGPQGMLISDVAGSGRCFWCWECGSLMRGKNCNEPGVGNSRWKVSIGKKDLVKPVEA